MPPRNSKKRKRHNDIIREAGWLGDEPKGFKHRNHRSKVKKYKNNINQKKEKIRKLEEEAWRELKQKINIIDYE
jgi:hypothetical protein